MGGGAVEAQSPSPVVEQEQVDVSAFLEHVRANVDYTAEPKFFKRMERRAGNPDYFTTQELPDGTLTLYYPDGKTLEPKVGYRHTLTNGVGNDYNGVEAGLNFFMTDDAVIVDIGKDGTLDGDNGVDLFNFQQIRNKTQAYLIEPEVLTDTQWTEVGLVTGPATTFKLLQTPEGGAYYGGDQNGFLLTETVLIEVPVVGTDEVVNGS